MTITPSTGDEFDRSVPPQLSASGGRGVDDGEPTQLLLTQRPTLLSVRAYAEAIGDAAAVVHNSIVATGLQRQVPTCPEWTTLDLVAHLGGVYRAVTSVLDRTVVGADAMRAQREVAITEGMGSPDVLTWLNDGLVGLLNALAVAPDDLDVWFFTPDAPPARWAWARRMAHESTIHAVDAMAARLGRVPEPRELWFGQRLARDGRAELREIDPAANAGEPRQIDGEDVRGYLSAWGRR